MAASCPSLPVGQSYPRSPGIGPVPVAVGEGSLRALAPSAPIPGSACVPLSVLPLLTRAADLFAGCVVSVGNWYVCACVQKQTSKCLGNVLGK